MRPSSEEATDASACPPGARARTRRSARRCVRRGIRSLRCYVCGASSFEAAAAAARADLRQGLDDLVVQARGHGVLHIVQSVRTGMVMARAVYGVEPSATVLELIALTLVCRDAAGAAAPAYLLSVA